jgi:hypothetical protein
MKLNLSFRQIVQIAMASAMLLVFLLVSLLGVYARPLSDDPVVAVYPADGSYAVGTLIDVEVWVEDVVNLYGVDIRLAFDPTRLQVLDANPDLPGVQVQPRDDILSPDFIIRREADNDAGTVWYAVTQINPSPPVSGSGALFSFSFETIGAGTTEVIVTNYQLADPNGMIIPAQPSGAVYEIVDDPPTLTPTATPVPPTATPTHTVTPDPPTATPTHTVIPDPPTLTPTATPQPPTATPTPTGDTMLRVLPASGSYEVGQTIDVAVWVEDVVDLYGVDIRLAFDPTQLQVIDANPDLPGVQVQPLDDILSPDFIIQRDADNVAGTVWYAVTQVNPSPPASGSGPLFAFSFTVLAPGLSDVLVTNDQLADQNGMIIPVNVEGASYLLSDDTAQGYTLFLPLVQRGQ